MPVLATPGVIVAHDPTPPHRSDSTSEELAWEHIAAVHELIGGRRRMSPDDDLLARLAEVRRELEKFSTSPETTANDRFTAFRLLMGIHRHQIELLTRQAGQHLSAASEVARVLTDVQHLPILDLIEQVPVSLCERLGFYRSMISSVRPAVWLPRVLCVTPQETPENKNFSSYVRGARIPLSRAPLESEIVRRRAPAISRRAVDDSRTFKEIVLIAKSTAYVAAPIVVHGRVIGFLHADRPAGRATIGGIDLEAVGTLSSCLSPIIERALLDERLRLESLRVATLLEDASLQITDAPAEPRSTLGIHGIYPVQASSLKTGNPVRRDDSLTPREREVLEYLCTGATNAQIAAALAVSEGTVKSHVRQILKKLGVSTRAAAVATFIRSDHRLSMVTRWM